MLVHVELVVFGDDEGEGEVVGRDELVVEGVEADGHAVLGLDVVEQVGELVEEGGGVEPSRRGSVEPLLHPQTRALERLLQSVLLGDGEPPDDGLVGLDPRIDLGVDQFANDVVLLYKLGGVEHIFDLDDLAGVLVVLEEGLEVGEVVVHVDCV